MKNQKPNPKLSSDDEQIWEEVVKGVKKTPKPNCDLSKPEVVLKEIVPSVNVFAVYQGENLEELKAGDFANIDYNTVKRFKRGEYRIEARLDLHGMIVDHAYTAVEEFVYKSYQRGLRCVQIITGKGMHRDDDIFSPKGVLKDLVPQWLNRDTIRPLILSFDYSPISEGGEGALLVLLRRARK